MQKQSLVLLHGALGSSKSFQSLIPHLSDHFELFVPDFNWHGDRSQPDTGFKMNQLIDDLQNTLDQKNLQSTYVFGFSMGGYVALALAQRRPTVFKKIMTLGTKLDWKPEQANKESKMLNADKIEEKVPKYAEHLKSLHGDNWKHLCFQTAEMMMDLGSRPILTTENISRLNLEVRLALGDQDNMVSLEETHAFYKALQKGELQVLPDCQHPLEKVNPKLLAQSIIEFFVKD